MSAQAGMLAISVLVGLFVGGVWAIAMALFEIARRLGPLRMTIRFRDADDDEGEEDEVDNFEPTVERAKKTDKPAVMS